MHSDTPIQYTPVVDDLVVGVVVDKHTENYRVDIGATHPAQLPALAFEGATKRNKLTPFFLFSHLSRVHVTCTLPHD